jgi:hypothetical protein
MSSRLARILSSIETPKVWEECGIPEPHPPRPYQCRSANFDRNTYQIWGGMNHRCNDPKDVRYHGRGITVCARWRWSYANFVEDMGERPPGLSLDRIDNDGDYEPGNCRWTTSLIQENNRSNNLPVTALGRTKNVSEWAREIGVAYRVLYKHYRRGEAITFIESPFHHVSRRSVTGCPER